MWAPRRGGPFRYVWGVLSVLENMLDRNDTYYARHDDSGLYDILRVINIYCDGGRMTRRKTHHGRLCRQ